MCDTPDHVRVAVRSETVRSAVCMLLLPSTVPVSESSENKKGDSQALV